MTLQHNLSEGPTLRMTSRITSTGWIGRARTQSRWRAVRLDATARGVRVAGAHDAFDDIELCCVSWAEHQGEPSGQATSGPRMRPTPALGHDISGQLLG